MPATNTPPTAANLDEVRRAAILLHTWVTPHSEPEDHPWYGMAPHHLCKVESDAMRAVASFALATIPANPTAPIDAEWLREVWGAQEEYADDVVFWWLPIGHDDGCLNVEQESGRVYIHDAGSDRIVAELRHITARHQFTKLATALGLTPKGDV